MNHRTSENRADQKAQSESQTFLKNKNREYDLAPAVHQAPAKPTQSKVNKLFPKLDDTLGPSAQQAKSQVISSDEIKQQRETLKREIALGMMQANVGLRDKNTISQ